MVSLTLLAGWVPREPGKCSIFAVILNTTPQVYVKEQGLRFRSDVGFRNLPNLSILSQTLSHPEPSPYCPSSSVDPIELRYAGGLCFCQCSILACLVRLAHRFHPMLGRWPVHVIADPAQTLKHKVTPPRADHPPTTPTNSSSVAWTTKTHKVAPGRKSSNNLVEKKQAAKMESLANPSPANTPPGPNAPRPKGE